MSESYMLGSKFVVGLVIPAEAGIQKYKYRFPPARE